MQFIKIARTSDFETVRVRSYRILTRHVGIFREEDGSFRAMEVGCKHENANLLEGRVKGDIVTCPWHGWKYNLRTGECLWGTTACLRPYALKIEGDDIYISIRPLNQQLEQYEVDFDDEMGKKWQ